MPEYSFDVVSQYDPAELTNAVDQARREVATRFDFKGTDPRIENRTQTLLIEASTEDLARSLQKKARLVSPKVQVRVQGDQLRVTSKEKDALQAVIKSLREDETIPVPLQFVNYRG